MKHLVNRKLLDHYLKLMLIIENMERHSLMFTELYLIIHLVSHQRYLISSVFQYVFPIIISLNLHPLTPYQTV